MKKIIMLGIICLFLMSFVLADREINANINRNSDGSIIINKNITTNNKNITITRTITRDCEKEGNSVECVKNMYREMEVERENNTIRLRVKNVTVTINGEIEVDENNKTFVNITGYKKEIKIMPDTASEVAIERLRLKVCSEKNNCTIELKEVGQGNNTRLRYVIQAMKERRFLWWKWKTKVKVEVDAETGEVE